MDAQNRHTEKRPTASRLPQAATNFLAQLNQACDDIGRAPAESPALASYWQTILARLRPAALLFGRSASAQGLTLEQALESFEIPRVGSRAPRLAATQLRLAEAHVAAWVIDGYFGETVRRAETEGSEH